MPFAVGFDQTLDSAYRVIISHQIHHTYNFVFRSCEIGKLLLIEKSFMSDCIEWKGN